MKKVAINGRFLTQPATGVQRYAYELVSAWDAMLATGEIDMQRFRLEIIVPHFAKIATKFKHITIRRVGVLSGNGWEQIELPWYTRGVFLFNPCNSGPLFKLNQAVTIHDASTFAVPYSYSFFFRMKYLVVLSVLAKTAQVVLTVSQFSKNEIMRYLHIRPEKIVVIPEGSDHFQKISPDLAVFKKYNIGEKPYLLTFGSNALHKNSFILNRASALLNFEELDFIVVGADSKGWFTSLRMSSADIFKMLGYVTNAELKALYQHAVALIYPSFYEGFGLPPIEAMACGCPAIVSNTASLPEVCGDAALYFDPDQPEDLAKKITKLICEPFCQEVLKKKGVQQAEKYLWDITARETWKSLPIDNPSYQSRNRMV
ncbi:MAG: hypothetical protein A2032_03825 [Chloroflexi bacterium RBG_19FT_COMBO_49_13]|nr:MAG: hypothetical protein A2032_03825 [Chloroflexi bacterium RBG_19FT_COMBO_49_13]